MSGIWPLTRPAFFEAAYITQDQYRTSQRNGNPVGQPKTVTPKQQEEACKQLRAHPAARHGARPQPPPGPPRSIKPAEAVRGWASPSLAVLAGTRRPSAASRGQRGSGGGRGGARWPPEGAAGPRSPPGLARPFARPVSSRRSRFPPDPANSLSCALLLSGEDLSVLVSDARDVPSKGRRLREAGEAIMKEAVRGK